MAPKANARGHPSSGIKRMEDDSHDRHGRQHQAHRQGQNWPQEGTKIANGGGEGGPVDEGRQEQQENELRSKLDVGDAGYQRERETTHHEQDGVGHVQPPGNRGQRGHHDQQQKYQFNFVHVSVGKCRGRAGIKHRLGISRVGSVTASVL